jgi:hypothetical protein
VICGDCGDRGDSVKESGLLCVNQSDPVCFMQTQAIRSASCRPKQIGLLYVIQSKGIRFTLGKPKETGSLSAIPAIHGIHVMTIIHAIPGIPVMTVIKPAEPAEGYILLKPVKK